MAPLAPVVICAGIGYAWRRLGKPLDQDFVSRLVLNIGVPALIIHTFAGLDLKPGLLLGFSRWVLLALAATGVLNALVLWLAGLRRTGYLVTATVPNTGNMGLPLALFAFGERGFAFALVIFVVVMLVHFSIGIALLQGRGAWRDILYSPVLHASWVALLILQFHVALPAWVDNTLSLLGGLTIPLMLLTLGAGLAGFRVHSLGAGALLAALRLGGGFAVVWLLTLELPLSPIERSALILQFSMPVAVFNYLLVYRYQRDLAEAVAAAVLLSTLAAVALVPVILSALR